jgi:hypothetical protein
MVSALSRSTQGFCGILALERDDRRQDMEVQDAVTVFTG